MEMIKNRLNTVQVIAMIFCRSLGSRDESSLARERFAPSSTNPRSATTTQTRLSVSSMVKDYGMHSAAWVQQAFDPGVAIPGARSLSEALAMKSREVGAAILRGLSSSLQFDGGAAGGFVSGTAGLAK